MRYSHEFDGDAKVQMDRLPVRLQAEVYRTLTLLQENPYRVGTELVGKALNREIRRVQAAQSVSMDYKFPINLRPNSKTPMVIEVLSLDIIDL